MSSKLEWNNTFKHLRLSFSLLLMPIYLFALSQASDVNVVNAALLFLILHLLVYPSSNLFNGYSDRDTGSIGGLKKPPPINSKMLLLANILDIVSVLIAAFIHWKMAMAVGLYILASRLYSYRPIRLKKYPTIGFLTIFIFQGGYTFFVCYWGVSSLDFSINEEIFYAMLATSFQIGAIYPLTQIYQHESDLKDGVVTLSYRLGYKGTFVFSAIFFALANVFYFLYFNENDLNSFYMLMLAQLPVVGFFIHWAVKVWSNISFADFKHTMQMNIIAAFCLNLFFIYLVY